MTSEGPIRLERRPEARTFTVGQLLQAVRDGKIRVPEFQRPLRWKSQHVLDFFDSIYRGFPVGTLLISRGKADRQTLHFGPIVVDAPEVAEALFIVDGQQRITTLAAAILHPDTTPRNGIFAVWFDLENERFVRMTMPVPPPTWIPLNIVGSRKATNKWAHEWPLHREHPTLVDRAFELNEALEGYQFPSYIVEQASDEALRVIFNRVNTSGVDMRESEVFDGLYGKKAGDSVKGTIARLADSTGFGQLNPEWFLDCFKAVEGFDAGVKFRDGMEMPSLRRTEKAMRRAISFLIDDAEIPHVKLLPYKLPLTILARFFTLHANPEPRARRQLSWWVWRGAISSKHVEGNHATIRELLAKVGPDIYFSIAQLSYTLFDAEGQPPLPCEEHWTTLTWDGHAAMSKLFALALYHWRPRDPASGKPLSQEALQEFLDDYALGKLVIDVSEARHGVLARHIMDLPAEGNVKLLANASHLIRSSHAIDEKAADALRRGDWPAFTKYRSQELGWRMQEFFMHKSGRNETERPSVAAMIQRVDLLANSA